VSNKFGIIGYGYVGKATHFGLLNNQKCTVHDTIFNTSILNLKNVENVFVCVPTNTDIDIDNIIYDLKILQDITKDVKIIIRSTLPLGASKKIQSQVGPIIYIPEFLRERFWDTDCLRRPLIVGCDAKEIMPTWLKEEEINECSTTEAELVKLFSNNYAVVRIAFANLFYDLSQQTGADYNQIKELFLKIQHNQTYLNVPGHDGTRGFSGKCLPKDLDFLINTLEEYDIEQDWFKNIRELNKKWQKKF
jgi:UDPglucose 6-dehydrogenase